MQVIKNPDKKDWKVLLQRPYVDNRSILESVQQILNAVRRNGDEAVRSFTKKFDGVQLENFLVSKNEITVAENKLSIEIKNAIQQARLNIEKFHRAQLVSSEVIETMPGQKLVGRLYTPPFDYYLKQGNPEAALADGRRG